MDETDFDRELELLTASFFEAIESNDFIVHTNCSSCNEKIEGQYLEAENGFFHIDCFMCQTCFNSIMEGKYTRVNGVLTCDKCFQKMIKICLKCSNPITDKIIVHENENYHSKCFVCNYCDIELDGVSYSIDVNSTFACVECYSKRNNLKCKVCEEYIQPRGGHIECLDYEGNKFHLECFKCKKCGKKEDEDLNMKYMDQKVICCDCIIKEQASNDE